MEKQYILSQINPPIREEFLRDGALSAIWQAHGAQAGVDALMEAMNDDPGLPPDKLTMRRQFIALAVKFHETQRDKQLNRALEALKLWDAFRRDELDEGTVVTVLDEQGQP